MISEGWRKGLLAEKDNCNQLVRMIKQSNANFAEENLKSVLEPYYNAFGTALGDNPTSEQILTSFELLLNLLLKGILREPGGEKENRFFRLISRLKSPLQEDIKTTLSYLVNVTSKFNQQKETIFLNRLTTISPEIKSIRDLKKIMAFLAWVGGKPEYREISLEEMKELSPELKNSLVSEWGGDFSSFQSVFQKSPFGENVQPGGSKIKYKLISGYPLLGGDFFEQPLVGKDKEGYYAISGKNQYRLYFDLFGDSLYGESISEKPGPVKIDHPFWKVVLEKSISLSEITSVVAEENFILLTVSYSYSIFLFYKVAS
ncbi:hypothetical protein LPTSP3_g28890 [Leptospira kobayashii]|uniref:Uncharacterized protein n=1 Tax=Leptospira kobayashii TaxID=1917830 RepID=A0ABN6KHD9_9LEPT|nr:hypothetical protein [Leptospira kobayashii]BDA79959.1 hypothetical protein LPTSP3_g28890 [Leptospira kobayashii]